MLDGRKVRIGAEPQLCYTVATKLTDTSGAFNQLILTN